MTEEEWLANSEAARIIRLFKGEPSSRKLRLFATACCRRVEPLMRSDAERASLVVAEQYADGVIGDAKMRLAFEKIIAIINHAGCPLIHCIVLRSLRDGLGR